MPRYAYVREHVQVSPETQKERKTETCKVCSGSGWRAWQTGGGHAMIAECTDCPDIDWFSSLCTSRT
jgi:DnaJ-class molecular chaperone